MKTLRSFSVYGFTMFFNAAVSFATVALLTHYLSESDYGIINLYNAFTIFLMPFIGIGIQFVLNVDFFKMDELTYRSQFTNAFLIPVITCIFFTLAFSLLFYPLRNLLKVNFFFTITLPLSCLLLVMNEVMINIIRNKNKYFLFAGFSISRNFIEIGLTILFVIGLGMTWKGRLAGALIALIITGVIIAYLIRKWNLFDSYFQKEKVKSIAKKGSPFVLERLAIFFMGFSDRFFIDHYKGIADVGLYSVGAQVAIVMTLATLTLNSTFYPYIFRKLSHDSIDYPGLKKISLAFLGISGVIAIAIISFTPFIFHWFIGPAFQPGKKYAMLLTIGYFFWAIYNLFIAYLLNTGKNRLIMVISIVGMLISILLNFFNVQYFGAIGAVYTSMIVYFSMAIMTIYFVNRFYSLKKIFSRG